MVFSHQTVEGQKIHITHYPDILFDQTYHRHLAQRLCPFEHFYGKHVACFDTKNISQIVGQHDASGWEIDWLQICIKQKIEAVARFYPLDGSSVTPLLEFEPRRH